jgi:hypothetical protein
MVVKNSMNREDYLEWSVYHNRPSGKYRVTLFNIRPEIWDKIIRGILINQPANNFIHRDQIGLLRFIVDEVIDDKRVQINVTQSIKKMFKRLDKL